MGAHQFFFSDLKQLYTITKLGSEELTKSAKEENWNLLLCDFIFFLHLLRPHLWKQQHILYRNTIG